MHRGPGEERVDSCSTNGPECPAGQCVGPTGRMMKGGLGSPLIVSVFSKIRRKNSLKGSLEAKVMR